MGVGYYVPEPDYLCPSLSLRSYNVDASGNLTFCCELSSFNGDKRPATERPDFVADMAHISLGEAVKMKAEAVARFRAHRLEEDQQGLRSEADKFPCRYCIRHFGKPEGLVPLRAEISRHLIYQKQRSGRLRPGGLWFVLAASGYSLGLRVSGFH